MKTRSTSACSNRTSDATVVLLLIIQFSHNDKKRLKRTTINDAHTTGFLAKETMRQCQRKVANEPFGFFFPPELESFWLNCCIADFTLPTTISEGFRHSFKEFTFTPLFPEAIRRNVPLSGQFQVPRATEVGTGRKIFYQTSFCKSIR